MKFNLRNLASPLLILIGCVCLTGCTAKLEKENESLKEANAALKQETLELKSKVTLHETLAKKAEEERGRYEKELATVNEKCRAEALEFKDKIRELQSEVARKETELKAISESTRASNEKVKLRNQKGDYETALTVLENLKKNGWDAAFSYDLYDSSEALGLSPRGRALQTLRDWKDKYRDAQARVWDLTKVSIESELAEKLSESLRSCYTEIGEAVERAFSKKTLDEQFKPLEERLKTLKEDVKNLK